LIPAFRTITNESHSGTENKSYFVHTWKTFYEQYLSKDGIYLPAMDGYEKPNILLRISDTRERCPFLLEEESSVAQGLVEMETNSQKTPTTYLIGISLYCSSKSSPMVSVEIVKEQVARFLHALSSQLELEENHITAVLFIVSNEYSPDISRQFTANKNWVLDSSGVYRGSENVPLNNRLLSFDSRTEIGTAIPSRCQLVVCSSQNLKEFLGVTTDDHLECLFGDKQVWWKHFDLLCSLLDNSLMELLNRISMNRNSHSRLNGTSNASLFDWNMFLREQCGFSDEEISYCLPKVEDIDEDELPAVTEQSLKDIGIDKPTLRFKIRSSVKRYLSRKQQKE